MFFHIALGSRSANIDPIVYWSIETNVTTSKIERKSENENLGAGMTN